MILERISTELERSIWSQDIKSWDDFLNASKIKGISSARKLYYDRRLKEARKELYSFNSSYFIGLLPKPEMWRLYDFFMEDAVFLDIETTGFDKNADIIMIGLYDGISTKILFRHHLHDANLDYLKEELSRYKLLVTFNGSSFDVPFIKKRYPDLLPEMPHFDVRSIAKKAGLPGGLKEIEKSIGIRREPVIEKFNGGDVSALWRMYKATGDEYYLDLLIKYNEDDMINLKKVAGHAVKKLKEMTFSL